MFVEEKEQTLIHKYNMCPVNWVYMGVMGY